MLLRATLTVLLLYPSLSLLADSIQPTTTNNNDSCDISVMPAATLLLPGQPKPSAIFDAIGRYKPTVFFGLPTLYTSLTKAEGAEAADFSSLRMALSRSPKRPTTSSSVRAQFSRLNA